MKFLLRRKNPRLLRILNVFSLELFFVVFLSYLCLLTNLYITSILLFCISFLVAYNSSLFSSVLFKAKLYEGEYKEDLVNLSKKHKVILKGIYHISTGDQGAYAAGFLNRKIVVFKGGIFNDFTKEELQGVMSHELGHHKNHDSLIMALSFVVFLVCTSVLNIYTFNYLFTNKVDLFISGFAISVVLFPFVLMFIRWREKLADDFVIKYTNFSKGLSNYLYKSAEEYLRCGVITSRNPYWIIKFMYTHPWIYDRVNILNKN